MRVYLSGTVVGSYRSQNIMKVLGDSGITFFYFPLGYSKFNIENRFVRKIVNVIIFAVLLPFRVAAILFSTHVFVLPMSVNFLSIVELIFARLFCKKIIVDYYISGYDTLVNDRKSIKSESFEAKWNLFEDRFVMRSSDIVIFLNKSESEYYQSVAGVKLNPSKVQLIPLCIDFKKELFQAEKTKKKSYFEFNVCWWGTYIPLHGLENLILAFGKLKGFKIKLYIFGNSEEKSKPYKEMVEELGLTESVVILNDYSFADGKLAPFLNENCHLAVGNFGSSEKAKTVLVNKLVDSLSLGLPCITMETKATRELLPENEGVILAQPNPDDIAEKIEYAYENREYLKSIVESGKQKYFDTFSPDAFKVRFLALLNDLPQKSKF